MEGAGEADPLAVVVGLVRAATTGAGAAEERNDAVVELLCAAVRATTGMLLRVDLVHRDAEVLGPALSPPAAATLRHRLRTRCPEPLLARVAAGQLAPCTARRVHGPAWEGSLPQREYRRDWGCDQVAVLPVAGGTQLVAYLLGRAGRDFSDDEVTLLSAVQPVIGGLVRLLGLHGGDGAWAPVAAAGAACGPRLRLTAREVEVLTLLARGHKAATIARMAGCSERTVHRHLSNAYHKLGVGDRLSAVAVARRRGLLAADPA